MNISEERIVSIRVDRYDGLLRKEALLETIEKLHGKTSEYLFRDVVGYLLQSAVMNHEQNS